MMARVRGEMASSSRRTSTLYVPSSMSSSTGTQPVWTVGAIVVGNPAATPITSSPGRRRFSPHSGEVNAVSARRLAEEPLLHSITSRAPRKPARSCATACVNRPSVHQPSSAASISSSNSS